MPTTVISCVPVAANFMSIVSPTCRSFPSASVVDTITVFGFERSATDPESIWMFATCSIVAGSIATTNVSEVAGLRLDLAQRETDREVGVLREVLARAAARTARTATEFNVRSAAQDLVERRGRGGLQRRARTPRRTRRARGRSSAPPPSRRCAAGCGSRSRCRACRRSGRGTARRWPAASGRANSGDSNATPMNVSAAPRPTTRPPRSRRGRTARAPTSADAGAA